MRSSLVISSLLSLVSLIYALLVWPTPLNLHLANLFPGRNVVLFTLVIDRFSGLVKPAEVDEKMIAIWNIFYHLYIPESDLKLLHEHVRRLLDASESMDTWVSSRYGAFVQFLNESTFDAVRKCWLQHAVTEDLTCDQNEELEQRARVTIDNTYRENLGESMALHGMRSAGVHFVRALKIMPLAFKAYWKTGVAGGNEYDKNSLGNNGRGRVNPMFAVSSAPMGGYAVHYGSDLLLGFHLAEAFDTIKSDTLVVERIVQIAKSQFCGWCETFMKTVKENRIKIILHYGDAVRLCHGLQSQKTGQVGLSKASTLRLGPWKSLPLVFDCPGYNSAPAVFDVIDTSNLADHVGTLNMFPATVPLLSRKSSSVLYIENLLLASKDPSQSLRTMLCSDVSTVSLLLGLAPTGHLLGFSTDSTGSEDLNLSVFEGHNGHQQYRLRAPWKYPNLGDMRALEQQDGLSGNSHQIKLEAKQLGEFLFKLYLKMFAYEDMSGMIASASLVLAKRQISTPVSGGLQYYTRLSLVVLLRLIKSQVITDWDKCVEYFVDKVQHDQTLAIGGNSAQELFLSLHIHGVWEDQSLKQSPLDLEIAGTCSARSKSVLKILFQTKKPPSIIHVALVVPRSKLRVFSAEPPDKIGTPGLHLSIRSQVTDNSFFAIHCFFGKLKPRIDGTTGCDVEEDERGWAGSADLIVTCPVPAYTFFMGEADEIRVSLAVNTSPSTVQFISKLGYRMIVYESGLENENRLLLLRESPGINLIARSSPQILEKANSDKSSREAAPVSVHLNGDSEVQLLNYHADIPKASDEFKSLGNGAEVSVTYSSPCTMTLQVGTAKPRILVYPFPVDGSRAKTKIARKSSWIEVAVPVSTALSPGGYDLNRFPVVLGKYHPSVWGMSRVNIQQQPIIKVSGDFDWLYTHMGITLSAEERAVNALNSSSRPPNGLIDLKESLNILFQSFVGRNEKTKNLPTTSFRLNLNGDSDTIIFANAICHDRVTSSIVMDAYVILLTHSRVREMIVPIKKINHSEALGISVSKEESMLWKQLMPSLAERCRQGWTHGKNYGTELEIKFPFLLLTVNQHSAYAVKGNHLMDIRLVLSIKDLRNMRQGLPSPRFLQCLMSR